jgi:hypothetical protein
MGLREPLDTTDQTHRVVTRTSIVSNDEGTGWVEVENTVIEATMHYGTAIHICINGEILRRCSPETLATVRQLTRLRDSETVLTNSGYPEYRASFPSDADTVRACLDPDGDDAWLARLFGTYELAVVREDVWLYHSVPHHSHIREVNATVDGVLDEVNDALDSIRGSAVFPVGPLVSWQADGRRYEIVPEFERFRITDIDEQIWVFSIDKLRAVHPNEDRLGLVLRWNSTAETDSIVIRGLRRLLPQSPTDPPTRINVPDRETLDEILDALLMVAAKLDYEFTVHE